LLAIAIRADEMAFACVFTAAGFAEGRRVVDDVFLGQIDRVAVNRVNQAVGAKGQIVAAVTDASRKFAKQSNFIELVVAVGVAEAVKTFGVVGVGVEGVVGVKQAAAFEQLVVDRLDALDRAVQLIERQAEQAFVFAGNRDAAA